MEFHCQQGGYPKVGGFRPERHVSTSPSRPPAPRARREAPALNAIGEMPEPMTERSEVVLGRLLAEETREPPPGLMPEQKRVFLPCPRLENGQRWRFDRERSMGEGAFSTSGATRRSRRGFPLNRISR